MVTKKEEAVPESAQSRANSRLIQEAMMGKKGDSVVVRHNVEGSGRPVENVAEYCTRFRFPAYSTYLSSLVKDDGPDRWQKAVLAIPGVTEVASYKHLGLYDLTVKKASAFGWDEVEPVVLDLLRQRHAELTAEDLKARGMLDDVTLKVGEAWKTTGPLAPGYVSNGHDPAEATQDPIARADMSYVMNGVAHLAEWKTKTTEATGQAAGWGALHDERVVDAVEECKEAQEPYSPFWRDGQWWFATDQTLEGPFETEELASLRAGFLREAADALPQAEQISDNYGSDGSGGH